jgi:hypothetical protein
VLFKYELFLFCSFSADDYENPGAISGGLFFVILFLKKIIFLLSVYDSFSGSDDVGEFTISVTNSRFIGIDSSVKDRGVLHIHNNNNKFIHTVCCAFFLLPFFFCS